eukprot:GHVR01141580.1.p1 GENE.GHVR01141580.1~~GHVR01141580.1.p1  ORF type:complete len:209 (-),score=47.07 GHVR01141580.1:197-823(-)
MGCGESHPANKARLPSEQLNFTTPEKSAASAANDQPMEAKIVLLGDSGVGKSSLALRFCQGRFSSSHEVTIGAAFLQQVVRLKDGLQLKVHIWDTGGQERFRAMIPLYYRDAAGAVVTYDCGQASSFEAVKFWAQELQEKGPPSCCVAVAGNKCDVPEWQVSAEDAQEFCKANDMTFVECSAKTGENVNKLFEVLATRIHQQRLQNSK